MALGVRPGGSFPNHTDRSDDKHFESREPDIFKIVKSSEQRQEANMFTPDQLVPILLWWTMIALA